MEDLPDKIEDNEDLKALLKSWRQLAKEDRQEAIDSHFESLADAATEFKFLPALGAVYLLGYPAEDHFTLFHSKNVSSTLAAVLAANFLAVLAEEDEEAPARFAEELTFKMSADRLYDLSERLAILAEQKESP